MLQPLQLSPVMSTGNTFTIYHRDGIPSCQLQLSPVMSTGNTNVRPTEVGSVIAAAIEPGHVDREHRSTRWSGPLCRPPLQLSPVMSTGNTAQGVGLSSAPQTSCN